MQRRQRLYRSSSDLYVADRQAAERFEGVRGLRQTANLDGAVGLHFHCAHAFAQPLVEALADHLLLLLRAEGEALGEGVEFAAGADFGEVPEEGFGALGREAGGVVGRGGDGVEHGEEGVVRVLRGVALLGGAEGGGGFAVAGHAEEQPRAPPPAGGERGVEGEGGVELHERGVEALEGGFALGEREEGRGAGFQVGEGGIGFRFATLGTRRLTFRVIALGD